MTAVPAVPAAGSATGEAVPRVNDRQVLAISVDGLNVRALSRLGRRKLPNLFRLLREGASTRNARAQVEKTLTLPNHTSMVTGRRIRAAKGGHGVTWNHGHRHATVQQAAGGDVASIFTRVRSAGGRSALFATEDKLALFRRSWPRSVHRQKIVQDGDKRVTRAVRRDLLRRDRSFTLLHLGAADEAGHQHGWMSKKYLAAVRGVDANIGTLLRAIDRDPRLDDVVVILTADHGGKPGTRRHIDADCRCNYRVPFIIWGPGVAKGDLYDLNPGYADPGTARVRFRGAQPVRNGDVANLAAALLGIGRVPGSRWGADEPLRWN